MDAAAICVYSYVHHKTCSPRDLPATVMPRRASPAVSPPACSVITDHEDPGVAIGASQVPGDSAFVLLWRESVVVHVTMPLTDIESRFRYIAGRLRGRATRVDENAKRNRFNEMLRSQFGGKQPVFDLAALQSTHEDGRPVFANYTGMRVRYLAPEGPTMADT